ncbi:hypothetical protein AB0E55_25820 [Amycolatopsis keratiniphila]|uniref:hypothetical protein n=1 Tax=Amycolatopsis keratiniphila TaxID=129921 RepID=UPI0033D34290
MSDMTPTVIFLPGISGMQLPENIEKVGYPDTATDLEKILKLHGLNVDYAVTKSERVEVAHRAIDIWLPIIGFAAGAAGNVALNILSNALYDRFINRRRNDLPTPTIHLRLVRLPDGTEVFELNGGPEEIVETIREIGKGDRDDV